MGFFPKLDLPQVSEMKALPAMFADLVPGRDIDGNWVLAPSGYWSIPEETRRGWG